ncbi:proteasome core particle subunit beta 2 [Starmerella bacillaris]|uniref:proteasome endopeptidase complex n=1 Tax=Starmerella bacillaris TaxID=1247836 RepID=A0AAV5RKB2_STABA|nr:proteasome core particle subunit beta 2 [Starmerella bacillaris]
MAGLSFDNYRRNKSLEASGVLPPKTTSTGTTIVGCKFNGGVILSADTRATAGMVVADKNCLKLHRLAPNIWCAGAGTASDNDKVTELESSQLEIHSQWTGRAPRVVTALTHLKQHLFKYQGHVGAYLIIAGVDVTGSHLFSLHAHGSTDVGPYLALGSGSMAALSVLESKWKEDLTKEEAMELCSEAIMAGVFNDLASGSNVDLCVIEKGKPSRLHRGYKQPNQRLQKQRNYNFDIGTTSYFEAGSEVFYISKQSDLETSAMEVDQVS